MMILFQIKSGLSTYHRKSFIYKDIGPIRFAITCTFYTSMIPVARIGSYGRLGLDKIEHPSDFMF